MMTNTRIKVIALLCFVPILTVQSQNQWVQSARLNGGIRPTGASQQLRLQRQQNVNQIMSRTPGFSFAVKGGQVNPLLNQRAGISQGQQRLSAFRSAPRIIPVSGSRNRQIQSDAQLLQKLQKEKQQRQMQQKIQQQLQQRQRQQLFQRQQQQPLNNFRFGENIRAGLLEQRVQHSSDKNRATMPQLERPNQQYSASEDAQGFHFPTQRRHPTIPSSPLSGGRPRDFSRPFAVIGSRHPADNRKQIRQPNQLSLLQEQQSRRQQSHLQRQREDDMLQRQYNENEQSQLLLLQRQREEALRHEPMLLDQKQQLPQASEQQTAKQRNLQQQEQQQKPIATTTQAPKPTENVLEATPETQKVETSQDPVLAKRERIYNLAKLLGFQPADLLIIVAELEANKNFIAKQTGKHSEINEPPHHQPVTPDPTPKLNSPNRFDVEIVLGMSNIDTTTAPGVDNTTVSGTDKNGDTWNGLLYNASVTLVPTDVGQTGAILDAINSSAATTGAGWFPAGDDAASVGGVADGQTTPANAINASYLIMVTGKEMSINRTSQSTPGVESPSSDSTLAQEVITSLAGQTSQPFIQDSSTRSSLPSEDTLMYPRNSTTDVTMIADRVYDNSSTPAVPESVKASAVLNISASNWPTPEQRNETIVSDARTGDVKKSPVLLTSQAQNLIQALITKTSSEALPKDDPIVIASKALLMEIMSLLTASNVPTGFENKKDNPSTSNTTSSDSTLVAPLTSYTTTYATDNTGTASPVNPSFSNTEAFNGMTWNMNFTTATPVTNATTIQKIVEAGSNPPSLLYEFQQTPAITTTASVPDQVSAGPDHFIYESSHRNSIIQDNSQTRVTDFSQNESPNEISTSTDDKQQMATAIARMYGISVEEAMIILSFPNSEPADASNKSKSTLSNSTHEASGQFQSQTYQETNTQNVASSMQPENYTTTQVHTVLQTAPSGAYSSTDNANFQTSSLSHASTESRSFPKNSQAEYNFMATPSTNEINPGYISADRTTGMDQPKAVLIWKSAIALPATTSNESFSVYTDLVNETVSSDNLLENNRQILYSFASSVPNSDAVSSKDGSRTASLATPSSTEMPKRQTRNVQPKLATKFLLSSFSTLAKDISNKINKGGKTVQESGSLEFPVPTPTLLTSEIGYDPSIVNLGSPQTYSKSEILNRSRQITPQSYISNQIIQNVTRTTSTMQPSEGGDILRAINYIYESGVVNQFPSVTSPTQDTPPLSSNSTESRNSRFRSLDDSMNASGVNVTSRGINLTPTSSVSGFAPTAVLTAGGIK